MGRTPIGHGCLVMAVGAYFTAALQAQESISVPSLSFEIEYVVGEDALPLDSVRLWYRANRDPVWREFGPDEDRQSPMTFRAPAEGEYEFYVVAVNTAGASSAAPTATTPAHLRLFVDASPPVVQLHPLRASVALGQPVVPIRWTAIDAHFGPRPVSIAYQRPPDDTWRPITSDPVANTGQYDWRVPDGMTGPVAVRVSVTDRGGHEVQSERRVLELAASPAVPGPDMRLTGMAAPPGTSDTDPTALPGSPRAREQAQRLFAEAMEHQARGEHREGIARLRQAIQLDPHRADVFAAMADMLYRVGDWDRALSAYELALREEPTMREALRGAAAVYRKKNDHAAAARALRTILRYKPNDAEVWMNLGDVAIYQGDEVLARECYTRASRIDPEATLVIADARKRLELMTEVSRQYRSTGP